MIHADLHYLPRDIGGVQVLLRCRSALVRAGLTLRPSTTAPTLNGDRLLICHHSWAKPGFLDHTTRPIVILERFDASGALDPDLARHPAVKLIVKGTVSSSIATDPRRPHYETLAPGTSGGQERREPLTAGQAAKYVSALTFGQYDRMAWLAQHEPDLDAPREVDVFFAGLMREDDPILGPHRRACVDAIKALPADIKTLATEGRPMRREAYFRACHQAKIIVSPWGYGEACYRDWEAWASGALLVKPKSWHVACWPGVYNPARCLTCAPDWSDLRETVERALARWPGLTQARRDIRRMFAESYRPDTIAAHFVGLLKDRGLA